MHFRIDSNAFVRGYLKLGEAITPFQDDRGAFIFWREWSRKVHFCLIVPDVMTQSIS
jgi:hypothetical protein